MRTDHENPENENSENRPPSEVTEDHRTLDDEREQGVIPTSPENALLREEQKKRGQYPLHDEPIGGA